MLLVGHWGNAPLQHSNRRQRGPPVKSHTTYHMLFLAQIQQQNSMYTCLHITSVSVQNGKMFRTALNQTPTKISNSQILDQHRKKSANVVPVLMATWKLGVLEVKFCMYSLKTI